jgi:hypothetical protein
MAASSGVVAQPKKGRSRITNNIYRIGLGIDMRSAAARRWRDIARAAVEQLGDSNPEALRELVGLRYTREQVQADLVAGNTRAAEDIVRLGRLIHRLETTLRATMAAKAIWE